MKITRSKLSQIIREELGRLNEAASPSDVAKEATAFSTDERRLIKLIVDSISKVVEAKDAHLALEQWVMAVYRSRPSSFFDDASSAKRIFNAIDQAETKDEHISTIVRMFVDNSAGLTGPLEKAEGVRLRMGLEDALMYVEF